MGNETFYWDDLTISAGFSRATASMFFNDNRQIRLGDGKTLEVVHYTQFCPLCDKQVITSALGQLKRINFTCIFKVFQLSKFCKHFENTRPINP